jgi:Fic family protein
MFSPRFQITPEIAAALMRIEAVRRELEGMAIHPRLLASLRETASLVSTHFSTQIEGNRLTLPEVERVRRGVKFPGRERDEREVKNHFAALAYTEKIAREPTPLIEREIQGIHALVMTGRRSPSPYRTQQNVIRDSGSGRIAYLPPEAPDVPHLMAELIEWVNASIEDNTLPAPIIASLAHYQFATIHPYLDGNGRTARLLTTLILRRAGYGLGGIYSLDEHYATNLAAYYDALAIGHHNYYQGRAEADVTSFVLYFCRGMDAAFAKIRAVARRTVSEARTPSPDILRELDPRQRKLLALFAKQGSATSEEIASYLKLSQRTVGALCRQWVASGFLELQNPSRKARSYRLAGRYV